jgi:diguanylate cyclase (GGDEF)-like protein
MRAEMSGPIQLLFQGEMPPDLSTSSLGPFIVQGCADLDEAGEQIQLSRFDALLLNADTGEQLQALLRWRALSNAVLDIALVVATPEPASADVSRRLALALRQAVERKRLEAAARRSYATDLGTGLPNHAQLMEHMTHLLALREREPAPMALLVLRIEGLAAAEAAFGAEAANVLRRKIAVRLRSGLRASDVVAALDADRFAVLLAWIDDAADGERVAAKLAQSLQRPLSVAGQDLTVGVGAGIARYPADARDADTLMRIAGSQASRSIVHGRAALAARSARDAAAANDETPPGG